jgi:ketosteroid isomerase-like protein
MSDAWERFRGELRGALDAIVDGDPEPYKSLWSTTDNASLLGAFGGRVVGFPAIADRLDRVASRYTAGRFDELEVLADESGGNLAYIVWVEAISSDDPDGHPIVRQRRTTHVFRREAGEWRIIHQHSDPLVDAEFPDAAKS